MVLEGIVKGLERHSHHPVVDGIVRGIERKKPGMAPELTKVHPSATEVSQGVFGAGRTPQGAGDAGKGHGKEVRGVPRSTKKMEVRLQEHIVAHNR